MPIKHNKYMLLKGGIWMEANDNFYEIKERFIAADLDTKIEIYTTVQGLSVEQYKELLSVFAN